MLPDDLSWYVDDRYNHHWLRCGNHIVALVNQKVTGERTVTINRHRWFCGLTGPAASLRQGKKMAERWAIVHAGRLRREVLDNKLRNPPAGDPRLSRAEL